MHLQIQFVDQPVDRRLTMLELNLAQYQSRRIAVVPLPKSTCIRISSRALAMVILVNRFSTPGLGYCPRVIPLTPSRAQGA